MENNITMLAKDALSSKLAECYVTIDGNRYNFMQAINLEAKMEKTKSKVPILGKTGAGNRSTGWEGTGSANFYLNTSIFHELMLKYKNTGEDIYFDMQVSNEDPTSAAGRQTVTLTGCNLDSIVLANFDADGEYLQDDVDFTFEDWDLPEKFNILEGML